MTLLNLEKGESACTYRSFCNSTPWFKLYRCYINDFSKRVSIGKGGCDLPKLQHFETLHRATF
jgi:hypothetical protein